MNLTAVVLTKNEENIIEGCLKSLSFADEIIVVDDSSTDRTREIAKRLGAKVFKRDLEDDFASQRNYGLEKSGNDWVLFVDADEKVSKNLSKEIGKVIQDKKGGFLAYYIQRIDVVFGKKLKHGETGNIKLLRLAKKNVGKWKREVHEVWDVKGEAGYLVNPIYHYPHRTMRNYVENINYWSRLHAQANYKEGKKSSLFKIIFYPFAKFMNNWILKLGFLDGTVGTIVALMMSFHSFLAWGELWLLQKRKD